MKTVQSLVLIGCVGVMLAGCTASRPPSYNLPRSDGIVPGVEYTVGRNENIYAIAQKNGVNMREIIALNNLKPPFALRSGQTITLPAKPTADGLAPIPTAAPLERIDKGYMAPPSNGGGGSAGIATSVKAEELPPIAGASVSSEPLTKPSGTAPTPLPPLSSTSQPKTTWTDTPQALPPSETPLTPLAAPSTQEAPPPNSPAPEASAATSTTQAPEAAAPAKTSGTTPSFGWPVRGTIISAFGPKGQGLDNDGINISAPKGSPVKAAEGGMVAYAGNEMKGFGNLVLIKHEGGWVTAYAHLERLVVAKDNIVAKGDMIGTVGTSGGVSSPQLHFETRQEGKPVDPELVIK